MRLALPLAVSLLAAPLASPTSAAARPFSAQPDDRPWGRGTLMPSFGLGGSFYRGGGGNLLVAAGVNYFVVNNLALGLTLRNFTTFLPSSYKQAYPGIEKSIPTNEFSLIPGLTLILYRSFRASPYISGGIGPVFLNHKRGVVAEWNAGPGVLIGIGRMFAIDLGVSFSMRFPDARCEEAFSYAGTDATVYFNACGLRWGIRGGLVFGFGVGRKRPPPPDYPPASAPAPASPGYPEPQPYAPAPEPPPPAEVPRPYAPPDEPGPAPLDPGPAPVGPTAPAGESVPVTPPPA